MDNVTMVADEVLPPLQNGDRSENGASIPLDVGGNVTRDGHHETEPLVGGIDDKEEALAKEDNANVESDDRQESPNAATKNQSIGEDQENPDKVANFDHIPVPQTGLAIATVVTSKIDDATEKSKQVEEGRLLVDTAAPFESVKEAVSKFGEIVDWKAHKLQTVERKKFVEQELENMREEIPEFKKKTEMAEEEKLRVLKELESTKRLVEELKLNLERAQMEERQAQQDSELVLLRVEEMEQGIADEVSVAARSQLEVAKARRTDAVKELKSVKEELDKTRNEYDMLLKERDLAITKSEEAVGALKDVERTVEELTIEMIAVKESLELAQVSHIEAEEHRIGAAMAKEQDSLTWEAELKQAEEELTALEARIQAAKDLKSNLESASTLLIELKRELAAYMESKRKQEVEEEQALSGEVKVEESEERTCNDLQLAVALAKKELKEVKLNIEKATAEVGCWKVAVSSLQSELEKERSSLAAISQREGIASVTAASLEVNLKNIHSEIELARTNEKEAKEKMAELPKKMQHAAQEADQSKLLAQLAREELRKAEEEAEHAKAAASTMESRLLAAQKEIEAAKASESLALAAIKALQESESMQSVNNADSSSIVTLSVEKYYELSKHAHEAEEEANIRVATVISQVEEAKLSELRSRAKLEELTEEIEIQKKMLETAKEKAEKAKGGKLGVEDELRKWRAENERRRKANESNQTPMRPDWSQARIFEESREFETNVGATTATPAHYSANKTPYIQEGCSESEPSTNVKIVKKKRTLFFPRIFMFLARRRARLARSK